VENFGEKDRGFSFAGEVGPLENWIELSIDYILDHNSDPFLVQICQDLI
jgi:hypothetical protein